MQLTVEQKALHESAVKISRQYRSIEWQLIKVLQEIDRSKLFKKLNRASLFQYAVQELGLSEPTAYMFISVARKAAENATLNHALQAHNISVSKASRITSTLNKENAATLIAFAQNHSAREIDFEAARLNPQARRPDKVKPISETLVQLHLTVSPDTLKKLKRVEDLEAQKGNIQAGLGDILEVVLDDYLHRHDPVKKAERHVRKKSQQSPTESGPDKQLPTLYNRGNEPKRVKLSAEIKHQIFARDKGRCTHVDNHGKRCTSERWIDIHHIQLVSQGGSNEPDNLATLCGYHHDLIHQLSFPLDGAVSWLRSPQVRYNA